MSKQQEAIQIAHFALGCIDSETPPLDPFLLTIWQKCNNAVAVPEQHPDDAAVDAFAEVMKAKLAKARAMGRSGWDNPAWSHANIARALLQHVVKGDPVDVANYAMFLEHRRDSSRPPENDILYVIVQGEEQEPQYVATSWDFAQDHIKDAQSEGCDVSAWVVRHAILLR
jgi:hypothetical protein